MKGIGFESMLSRHTDYARAFGGRAYSASRFHTAAQAPAADAILASLRNPGASGGLIVVVTLLEAILSGTVAATVQGQAGFKLQKVTSYSVEDTGGSVVAPSPVDSRMAAAVASFRFNASGKLTAGTRTPDAGLLATHAHPVLVTAGWSIPKIVADLVVTPIVLRANEGLEVLELGIPTSLTGFEHVNIEWAEIPEKNFPV